MKHSGRLIHIVSSNSWGGRERYVLDICRSFMSRNWSVSVYTRNALVVDKHFKASGIDLRHIALGGFFDMVSVLTLSRDLRHEQKSTVLHVHNYKDAFIAILARKISGRQDIRIVTTCHKAKKGKDSWLFNKVYNNIDTHLFVSDLSMREFLKTWEKKALPFPKERICMLRNSIYADSYSFVPEPISGPKVAMFHGRLSPEKGVETIIEALPKLKNRKTRLWIVGTGDPDYIDTLKRKALSLDVMDMIDWKGYVEDVHTLIPLCHYGVLPSVWQEPFGLANIEYMLHGRPQICTNNGAQLEYLTDKNEALLISPGDVDGLAQAMIQLTEDEEQRKAMGKASYEKFVAELSWNKFCNRLEQIYKSAK